MASVGLGRAGMNDVGFGVHTKMGELLPVESLQTWTPWMAARGMAESVATIMIGPIVPFRVDR